MRWEGREGDEGVVVREGMGRNERTVVVRDGGSGEVVEGWKGGFEEGGGREVGVDEVGVSAFGEGAEGVEELKAGWVLEVSGERETARRGRNQRQDARAFVSFFFLSRGKNLEA